MILCLTALILIIGGLAGCAALPADDGRPEVVCTTFAQYDWVRRITDGTDRLHITLLVGSGRDMHSYNPSVADIAAITESDLLIYDGGVSEAWVGKIAENRRVGETLNLMEILGDGVRREELPEGAGEEHDRDGHVHEPGETEADEHVWLSLRNASLFCGRIAEALCRLDETNADVYRRNNEAYCAELASLDRDFASFVASSAKKTLIFADRYPFRYLAEDYGLSCYAAFPGCSSESDASFETVIVLAEKVDETGAPGVLVIDGSDEKVARAVLGATKKKTGQIFRVDSMQSVVDPEKKDYLETMRQNLAVFSDFLRENGETGERSGTF